MTQYLDEHTTIDPSIFSYHQHQRFHALHPDDPPFHVFLSRRAEELNSLSLLAVHLVINDMRMPPVSWGTDTVTPEVDVTHMSSH